MITVGTLHQELSVLLQKILSDAVGEEEARSSQWSFICKLGEIKSFELQV